MKKLIIILMTAVGFSFLSGCNWDEDASSMKDIWVGFGLIHNDSVAHSLTIVMDDGEILFPENPSKIQDDFKDKDRVLTDFTIQGTKENSDHLVQYNVSILSIRKILFKNILDITPAMEDSIGNDPIEVRNHWLKADKLNFELQYSGGSKIHYINLVKQPGAINPDAGPVVLELRHNSNGDTEQMPLSAIVTFDMNSLKVAGKTSTPYKIVAKGFNGHDFEYSGEYKY
jgi:hypothetical protein